MFIRPELGGKGTGCLFQFTYCVYGIHTHVYPISDNILNAKVFTCYNSLHASGEFCRLQIAICKQFEPR